jgi:hypothetical protein
MGTRTNLLRFRSPGRRGEPKARTCKLSRRLRDPISSGTRRSEICTRPSRSDRSIPGMRLGRSANPWRKRWFDSTPVGVSMVATRVIHWPLSLQPDLARQRHTYMCSSGSAISCRPGVRVGLPQRRLRPRIRRPAHRRGRPHLRGGRGPPLRPDRDLWRSPAQSTHGRHRAADDGCRARQRCDSRSHALLGPAAEWRRTCRPPRCRASRPSRCE